MRDKNPSRLLRNLRIFNGKYDYCEDFLIFLSIPITRRQYCYEVNNVISIYNVVCEGFIELGALL